jgi:hypothetical protein
VTKTRRWYSETPSVHHIYLLRAEQVKLAFKLFFFFFLSLINAKIFLRGGPAAGTGFVEELRAAIVGPSSSLIELLVASSSAQKGRNAEKSSPPRH